MSNERRVCIIVKDERSTEYCKLLDDLMHVTHHISLLARGPASEFREINRGDQVSVFHVSCFLRTVCTLSEIRSFGTSSLPALRASIVNLFGLLLTISTSPFSIKPSATRIFPTIHNFAHFCSF